jgi:hypothetical protein
VKPKNLPTSAPDQPKTKRPISLFPTEDESTERIAWRFADVEMEGCEWGWHQMSETDLRATHQWLSQIEKMTWNEATTGKGAGVKSIRVAEAHPAIQRRLEAINRDDVEQLWEFRSKGKSRIWGVRIGNVCHLLWWDPGHDVWEVKRGDRKKRTGN